MWCCFTTNTVSEPTKLKPLTAEVPVTTKPVTLMFRLPSENADETVEKKEEVVEAHAPAAEGLDAGVQGEEVPSLGPEQCSVGTILLTLATIALLYAMMLESESAEL